MMYFEDPHQLEPELDGKQESLTELVSALLESDPIMRADLVQEVHSKVPYAAARNSQLLQFASSAGCPLGLVCHATVAIRSCSTSRCCRNRNSKRYWRRFRRTFSQLCSRLCQAGRAEPTHSSNAIGTAARFESGNAVRTHRVVVLHMVLSPCFCFYFLSFVAVFVPLPHYSAMLQPFKLCKHLGRSLVGGPVNQAVDIIGTFELLPCLPILLQLHQQLRILSPRICGFR